MSQWGKTLSFDSSCEKLGGLSKLSFEVPKPHPFRWCPTPAHQLQLQKLFTLNGVVLPTNRTAYHSRIVLLTAWDAKEWSQREQPTDLMRVEPSFWVKQAPVRPQESQV